MADTKHRIELDRILGRLDAALANHAASLDRLATDLQAWHRSELDREFATTYDPATLRN
jgi:hypothetical protein